VGFDVVQRLQSASGMETRTARKIMVATNFSDAVAAITQRGRDIDADLIVVGTHGRTGIAHAMLGSVAERVVRRAGCPVLTVPFSRKAA
jgi:nucleotide-binding universal stress UspA family protein